MVLDAMAAAGVDERWCLGDLAGPEPVTTELVDAARQLDLLIAGNHDAWALGPDQRSARGRDVFRLARRATASRHGIDCWHGSPRHPLLGFLTEASAARVLPHRRAGSLGLVGHTHEPALFTYENATTRAVRPVPCEAHHWLETGACFANPGAVCGNPRDAASWWLVIDLDTRTLQWQRQAF
jgi:predicted phosphodiesterase